MRTILVHSDVKQADQFCNILSKESDVFHVSSSVDDVEPEDVEVVIIWLRVPDYLVRLPNLKLLLVCGSGVDHIVGSHSLPLHIPLIRIVDPFLRNHVADYVVDHIFKRFFPHVDSPSQEVSHTLETTIQFRKPKVGIMGLGLVGEATAEKLIKMGFEVCAWVRTFRPRILKEVYVGTTALADFAKNCEVLVCQLPLTKQTTGILDSHLFSLLPHGAYLINVGRGGHLNEVDLLLALESNRLSGACLDVLTVQPLPLKHPFREHSKITLTPHIAGHVQPKTQATYAAKVIAGYYGNGNFPGIVDYSAQY